MMLTLDIIKVMFDYLNISNTIHKEHAVRVTSLCYNICKKLELNQKTTELICIASLIHDLGLIILPESVFNKVESLTEFEINIIKTHVFKTTSVLESLNIDEELINIIKYHHERLDGTGYPYSTKIIPYESKILMVADVVEAMSTKRSYRESCSFSNISNVLMNENKFDKDISKIALSILIEMNDSCFDFDIGKIWKNS